MDGWPKLMTFETVRRVSTKQKLGRDFLRAFTALTLGFLVSLWALSAALAATTFIVDSTGDTSDTLPGDGVCDDGLGTCTLRAAIEEANALSGKDVIHFSIDGAGPHTIAVLSAMPDVTEPVVVDATTEPDFSGTPMVELTRGANFTADGLRLLAGDSTVRGLAINGFFRTGILINGGGGSVIEGNFIGTDVTGTVDKGNFESGVRVVDSPGNSIGGISPGQGNLISGNGSSLASANHSGISIEGPTASENAVLGNFIGTDVTGTTPLGNSAAGVAIAAPYNEVGGIEPGAGNLISGNTYAGVLAHGGDAVSNVIAGNLIGTDSDGLSAVGNGIGVIVRETAHSTVIGGATASARNIISGNSTGVAIWVLSGFTGPGNTIKGNYVGIAADGSALGNGSVGIDVQGPNNQIGGTEGTSPGGPCTGACNVISSNGTRGVVVWTARAANNVIEGNYVGTDPTGTVGRGNGSAGVIASSEGRTVIGGSVVGSGNLISANRVGGIFLGSSGHLVQGNLVGTDVTGTSALGNLFAGISVGGSDNVIGGPDASARNLISGNLGDGLRIDGGFLGSAARNVVQGNYIGTELSGMVALPNAGKGVYVLNESPDNLIGGSSTGAGNLISGNAGVGVDFFRGGATGNVLSGNRIGTDATGTAPLGNGSHGVALNAPANLIGGTGGGEGNVISSNEGSGVAVLGGADSVFQGNVIGADISGILALGNGRHGVEIYVSGSVIGGTSTGAGNVISANAKDGLFIAQNVSETRVQGNLIGVAGDRATPLGNGEHGVSVFGSNNLIGGTDAGAGNVVAHNGADGISNPTNFGNSYLANNIRSNTGLGIDLGADGVSPNVGGDGSSDLRNYPVITAAVSGTVVEGTLESEPSTTYRLEFFSNVVLDPTGFGEGELFLGAADVTTNASGRAEFRITVSVFVPPGHYLTATATNPAGSTSEFSAGQIVTENRPPISEDDGAAVDEGGSVMGNVLANDSDPDGHNIFATTTPVTHPSRGEVAINADGTFTYTHDGSETTSDAFVYEVCDDGAVSLCSTATVAITIVPVNDPPVAFDDQATTNEDVAVTIEVMANDVDPEGDQLSLSSFEAVSTEGGSVLCTGQGACTYAPPLNFFGTDTFAYSVVDSGGLLDTAAVSMEVTPVNDPPVALDDAATTDQDVSVTVDVLANDFDPDNDVLAVTDHDATTAGGGSVTCTTAGSCAYVPPAGFSGTDSFTYTLSDLPGLSDTATVTVTVVASNTPPEIDSLSAAPEPQAVGSTIVLDAHFTDPDQSDVHTYEIDWGDDGPPTDGSLEVGGRSITSEHSYSTAGVYTVTLTVNDGESSDSDAYEFVVVYDPDDGFVTGGGWIDSPAGAYTPDPSLSGQATFGFVSKYKKGTTIPIGNTEFKFKAGDLNLHSSAYDWLVVTGSNYAMFKGVGTINGEGAYNFRIWAGDDAPDTFRIKIWTEDDSEVETVVYDNGFDQALGSGNIVIHQK